MLDNAEDTAISLLYPQKQYLIVFWHHVCCCISVLSRAARRKKWGCTSWDSRSTGLLVSRPRFTYLWLIDLTLDVTVTVNGWAPSMSGWKRDWDRPDQTRPDQTTHRREIDGGKDWGLYSERLCYCCFSALIWSEPPLSLVLQWRYCSVPDHGTDVQPMPLLPQRVSASGVKLSFHLYFWLSFCIRLPYIFLLFWFWNYGQGRVWCNQYAKGGNVRIGREDSQFICF